MDTTIAYTDEEGRRYNRHRQELVDCSTGCGRLTTMTGTKLCDFCWEAQRMGSPHSTCRNCEFWQVDNPPRDWEQKPVRDYDYGTCGNLNIVEGNAGEVAIDAPTRKGLLAYASEWVTIRTGEDFSCPHHKLRKE